MSGRAPEMDMPPSIPPNGPRAAYFADPPGDADSGDANRCHGMPPFRNPGPVSTQNITENRIVLRTIGVRSPGIRNSIPKMVIF